jgi:hypothetical protein
MAPWYSKRYPILTPEPKVRLRKPEVASRMGQQREQPVLIQLASAFKELG